MKQAHYNPVRRNYAHNWTSKPSRNSDEEENVRKAKNEGGKKVNTIAFIVNFDFDYFEDANQC